MNATEKPTKTPEIWTLTFRALPSPVPVELRVRALLKRALRQHQLRCVSLGRPPVAPALITAPTKENGHADA
jgi:hypothetical protein